MPRVPMQSLVAPREYGVQLPPGTFQQTAQATANLVSSIAGATEMVQNQFIEAQNIKNKSDISEGRRNLRMAQAEFQNQLVRDNVEPSQWGPMWEKQLPKIRESLGLDSSKTPPVVKQALEGAYNDFAGSSYIQLSGAALKENRKRARQNFDRDYQYLRQTEDWGGIYALIDDNAGSVLDVEEAKDLERTTRLAKKRSDMDIHLKGNPIKYAEAIRNGEYDLPKRQQQLELKKSERERDHLESDGLRAVDSLVKAGEVENEEDLKAELDKNPFISDTKKKAFMKNYLSSKPLPFAEQFALQDRIDGNVEKLRKGQISPEEYEAEWVRIQSDIYAYGDRAGVGRFKADLHNVRPSLYSEEKINDASDRQKAKILKPIQTTARALVKERAEGLASIAYAGQKNIEQGLSNKELADNATLKKRLDEHAVLLRSALQEAMNDFILSFPEGEMPSEPDLMDFLNKNADHINAEVLRKPKKQPEKKTLTPEEKAQKWLEPSGSLLPPLGWEQE